MKLSFKQSFRKSLKWFVFIFVLMFGARLIYGYVSTNEPNSSGYYGDFFESIADLHKNYASEMRWISVGTKDVKEQAPNFESSQKYEKTASVKSRSANFETDEQSLKSKTKDAGGIIQYEKNTGNKGAREIHLMIGIDPVKFDSFYVATQHIGRIVSTEVTKVDKTTEYRQLNAKKASLEKTLISLNELKSKPGAISDYVGLHDKILTIESQLQELGVELGNFSAENEFCTIRFSLYEGGSPHGIPLSNRLKIAFEWTIEYYALLMLGGMLSVITIFILLLIIEKLRIFKILGDE